MTVENLAEEGKIMSADGVSHVPTPVDGEGGKVKDRKADLKKKVDPNAETLPEPPLSEGEETEEGKDTVVEGETDVLRVFEGVELSEEAKHKLKVVFEAAVAAEAEAIVEAKLEAEKAAIVEAHDAEVAALKEAHEAQIAELEENLNTFMEDASAKWLEENRIAIQDARTVEIAEAFVNSMKDLFVEHEIMVDVDNAEAIAALEEELATANANTNEAILEGIAARKELAELKSELIFTEVSEGLTTSQSEKLRSLSKKLVKEDADTFKQDLISIKESFFQSQIVVEEKEEAPIVKEEPTATALSEDVHINAIAQAINARNFA